jgi:hypothetical protein
MSSKTASFFERFTRVPAVGDSPEAKSTRAASFLGLPVELRLSIYRLVFNRYDSGHSREILLVCRQIRSEALPLYLEWTRYFGSFDSLSKWTASGNPYLLELVQDISIQILNNRWDSLRYAASKAPEEEISDDGEHDTVQWWKAKLGRLSDALPNDYPAPQPDMAENSNRVLRRAREIQRRMFPATKRAVDQKLQGDVIDELWTALLRMPNVRYCWVVLQHPDAKMQPFTHIFLEMISAAFPRISTLTFFAPLQNLEFLRKFEHLRLLRFTGYSTNTPDEFLDILLSLKALDSLSLYRYPETYDHAFYDMTSDGKLPLTESVIERMRPLASLEINHMSSRVPSDFLTLSMLGAWTSHLSSLRTLKIGTDERLKAPVVKELLDLISQSRLTKLQIRSQGDKKPLDISTYLPKSIKRCDAALKCDEFKGIGSSGTYDVESKCLMRFMSCERRKGLDARELLSEFFQKKSDWTYTGNGGQFHSHGFTEIEHQDPQYHGILNDSFATQLLH